MDGLFRYTYGDAEVEMRGLVLAKSEEEAVTKARVACYITNVEDAEEDVEVTHIMSKDKFEELVVTGSVETFYDDWD